MRKVVLLLIFPFVALSSTYYVATWGKNTFPGTKEKPWATPGFGSKQILPGDTLIIMEGEYTLSRYWDDMITPPSGTPEAWTVIKGEGKVVLRGRNNLYSAIDIGGKSYIRIENLEITNFKGEPFREGVNGYGQVSHIELKNLHIHHIDEFGIDIQDAQDLKIIDCDIRYCGFGAIGGPRGEKGGWRNVLIKGCSLSYSGHYYQGGPGPGPYDRPDGLGIEPSEGPVEITDTIVEHNLGDGLDSKARNTYIHHTIVANNRCDGVKIWGDGSRVENVLIYGRGDGDPTPTPWASLVIDNVEQSGASFEIINVTIHDANAPHSHPVYFGYSLSVPINVTMRNAIIEGNDAPVYVGDLVNFTVDHSLIFIPHNEVQIIVHGREYSSEEIEAGRLGVGNISKPPEFISPAWGEEGDYHLRSTSPAIDSGTGQGAPDTDLDYKTRPMGEGFDMGAYEYGESEGDNGYNCILEALLGKNHPALSRFRKFRDTVLERTPLGKIIIFFYYKISAFLLR